MSQHTLWRVVVHSTSYATWIKIVACLVVTPRTTRTKWLFKEQSQSGILGKFLLKWAITHYYVPEGTPDLIIKQFKNPSQNAKIGATCRDLIGFLYVGELLYIHYSHKALFFPIHFGLEIKVNHAPIWIWATMKNVHNVHTHHVPKKGSRLLVYNELTRNRYKIRFQKSCCVARFYWFIYTYMEINHIVWPQRVFLSFYFRLEGEPCMERRLRANLH